MTTGAHIVGVTRARSVDAHTMAGAVACRIGGRASVDGVRDIEAGHVVGIVTEEVE